VSGEASKRLVILSGPSCVGKSPVDKALGRFYPELRGKLRKLVLYNTRATRPGEVDGVDYHFRIRSQVEALRAEDGYAVFDVRGDLQALDVEELHILSKAAISSLRFSLKPFNPAGGDMMYPCNSTIPKVLDNRDFQI